MDAPTRVERGRKIEEWISAIGISQREFQRQTGIDRDTLLRAIAGDASVRENTYKRIEAKMRKLDEELGTEAVRPPDLAEIHITDGGREIVVRGPVSDLRELEASVARLMRELSSRGQED